MLAGGDNFTVSDTRGRITEEDHYYAFGLKISGISSRKFDGGVEGELINHYLYNDKELFEDADLNWYDSGFRNYDPQIGRFPQLDPLTNDYPYYTPYQYAGNEPIANVDLDGLEPFGSTVASAVGDAVVTTGSFMPNMVIKIGGGFMPKVGKLLSTLKSYVSTLLTVSTATASVTLDNISGGIINSADYIAQSGSVPSSQVDNWNQAVKTANQTMVAFGGAESIGGGGIAAGSIAITEASLGTSIEITGPGFLFGTGMALHGAAVAGNASRNLASGNGLIKSEGTGGGSSSQPKYKKPKSGVSGKEGAKDVPDWVRGEKPFVKESGKDFAKRLLDKKYGQRNYKTGPGTEYNKIQKWGDRSFE